MKKSVLVTPFILSLITFVTYIPSLYYSFQFDDLANIVKFYDIRHKTLQELFFSNTRWISYWLNTQYYKIARFDPFYYRLGNVLFHCITGILVFFVIYYALSGLRKNSYIQERASLMAGIASLLFLLHPVQTQTVSYVIQGQLEGLAGLAMMSMVLCFLWFTRVTNFTAKSILLIVLCLLAFLACGTKEIAIVSPFLLIIVDWFFVVQGEWQQIKKRWWVHALIFGIVGSIYIYFLKPQYFARVFGLAIETNNNIGNVLTKNPHAKITSLWYCMSQFKVILHYITIFIWPFNISVDYDWVLVDGFFALDCWLPLVVLLCIGYYILKLLIKDTSSVIAAGFVWFFVTILPRSSIIPSTELVADYKTYTASVGIFLVLALAIVYSIERIITFITQRKKIPYIAQLAPVGVLAVFLSFLTFERNQVWESGEKFWRNIIANAPGKARAYNNYGVSLSEKGQFKEAIAYFKKAIAMDKYYPDPCNNIAVAYSAIGEIDNAIDAMNAGIKIQPYYPEAYNNLASFLLQKKEYRKAENALKTAIKLRPHYGKAHFNTGRMHLEQGNYELAYQSFKKCCMEADFDNDVGFSSYGMISLMTNRPDEALFAYKKVLHYKPNDFSARFNIANAYFMKKEYVQAETVFAQLLQEAPQESKVLFNMAESLFAQKKYQQALEYFTKISKTTTEMPQVYMRMAACNAYLGNNKVAEEHLKYILAQADFSPEHKKQAQTALTRLNQKRVNAA